MNQIISKPEVRLADKSNLREESVKFVPALLVDSLEVGFGPFKWLRSGDATTNQEEDDAVSLGTTEHIRGHTRKAIPMDSGSNMVTIVCG